MRYLFFSIATFLFLSSFSQSFEIFQEKSYRNSYSDVINVGDTMWVVSGSWGQMNSFSTYAYLEAYNVDGELLWEFQTPPNTEVRKFLNLKQLPNGNLAVCGFEMWCCDCSPPFFQVHIISPHGELIEQVSFESLQNWVNALSLGVSDSLMVAANPNGDWSDTDHSLVAMDHFGDSLWMAETYASIRELTIQDSLVIAISDSVLYRYSEGGMLIDSLTFLGPFIDSERHRNGEAVLATISGLFTLNQGPVLDEVVSFEQGVIPSKIFPTPDYLCMQFENQVECYDTAYNNILSIDYSPLPYLQQSGIAASSDYFAVAGWREFEDVATPVYRGAAMYTVGFDGSQTDHFPDLGLSQVQMSINNIEEVAEGVFFVEGNPSGYFVNTGNTFVNSAYLNYFGPGICNASGNHTLFNELNLFPGDSAYFEFSEVSNYFVASGDSLEVDLCIFLTDPDGYYDRNELNDEACGQAIIWLESEEIRGSQFKVYPNPTSEMLFVEYTHNNSLTSLQIFSSNGQVVLHLDQLSQTITQLDVSKWHPGLYVARITAEDGTVDDFRFVVNP